MASVPDAIDYVQFLDSSDIASAEEVKELILEVLRNAKDGSLLNAVIDFFLVSHSKRCLTILETVREPFDKQLFDRLTECIKGQHKLSAITVLGHLVSKPPPWLHKITNHSLMKHLVNVLKTEVDVPILVGAVLDITCLLPIVPVSVQSYLQDIMEGFNRLAIINFKNPTNIPDVYLLHLHAAIYSLFHRLHGMFPCHLLTFLRHSYIKKENAAVFRSKIAPMLERVRMNPLLVTASKDKEVSRERWRQKEIHDIVVDCAKLSLDMIEGCKELDSCPFTEGAIHQSYEKPIEKPHTPSFLSPAAGGSLACTASATSSAINPYVLQSTSTIQTMVQSTSTIQPIVQSTEIMTSMWSPSINCGLSTPPGGASASVSTSVLDGHVMSQPGVQLTTARTTPYVHGESVYTGIEPTTPVYPHTIELQSTVSVIPNTPGSSTANANKRLSAMSLSLSGKVPVTPTPISPQKFDFSSDPPLQKTPVRILNFQNQSDEKPLTESKSVQPEQQVIVPAEVSASIARDINVASELPSTSKDVTSSAATFATSTTTGTTATSPRTSPLKRKRPPPLKSFTADTFDFDSEYDTPQPHDPSGEGMEDVEISPSCPSMNQFPDMVGSLQVSNMLGLLEADEEVQKLTGSTEVLEKDDSCSDSSDALTTGVMTAESVQTFMKSVKRIRFNSMNVGKLRELSQEQPELHPRRSRSNSCPDLESECNLIVDSSDITVTLQRRSSGSGTQVSLDESASNPKEKQDTLTKVVSGISFAAEPAIMEDAEGEVRDAQNETEKEDDEEKIQNLLTMFPYHHLFPIALPAAPFMKCYNCRRSEGAKQGQEIDFNTPLFTSYSPPDLLDRHVKLSCQLHSHELDALDCPTKTGPPMRHFGGLLAYPQGLPPADEIKILRGEIQLLHNQVMYERQKRELYAKRNRRLLGKITKATALEEQNTAMQDQLRLKENEVTSLHVTVRLQQKQVHDLQLAKDKLEKEKLEQQRSLKAENRRGQNEKHDLQIIVDAKLKENEDLKRELDTHKAKIFNVVHDADILKQKAEFAKDLQDQVVRLNQELLLMGELQQKYRGRLVTAASMHNPKPEMQFIIETYKKELTSAKAELAHKTVHHDALVAYRSHQDDQLAKKDVLIVDLKRQLEHGQNTWIAQRDAAEDKYRAQQKINAQLSARILEMMAKLEQSVKQERPSTTAAIPINIANQETGDDLGATGGGVTEPNASSHSSGSSHVDDTLSQQCWEISPSDSTSQNSLRSRAYKPH